ncbi:MAG: hypothetical protein A2X94_12865 [Bdellovibrionales bacterium GWB1_55_8]|nr:MAG: hypothetical protein A2X94_12865 [Bdellovibrionales bacterium GWB1_55_8]
MESTPAPETKPQPQPKKEAGIALMLVIAAMSVLSILVTEFTYVAQVNQKIAFDSMDQVKAHYLAKSGFKLSLLRLKVYQTLKDLSGGGKSGGGAPMVPKALLDKLWSFPVIFPIPADIPGLSMIEKDQITAFQKASGLEGTFTSAITSESGKFNLNLVLAPYVPQGKTAKTGAGKGEPPPPPSPGASPSPAPTFNPEEARQSLEDYLKQVLQQKFEADPDFASEYRDFRMDDFMDNLLAWVDRTYQRTGQENEAIADKRAPFYSVSELRMIQPLDDALYDVLAPTLTVSPTPGVNVNTMNPFVLQALFPEMTQEEVDEFFKYRDSEEEDHLFKSEDEFFKYISQSVSRLAGADSITQVKEQLARRNIRIVVDESNFKITVQAKVNQSTRLIEAWITLGTSAKKDPAREVGLPEPELGIPAAGTPKKKADAGLNVTFMRIL